MQFAKVQKKIFDRSGVKVKSENGRCYFYHGGMTLRFFVEKNGECSNYYIVRDGDQDDLMTDYFAGSFYQNITQCLDRMAPKKEERMPKGTYVCFKPTKKNIRWHRDGLRGVVVEVNKNYGEYWVVMTTDGKKHTYCTIRDIGEIK